MTAKDLARIQIIWLVGFAIYSINARSFATNIPASADLSRKSSSRMEVHQAFSPTKEYKAALRIKALWNKKEDLL